LIRSHDLCGSMGCKITCYDNVITESFFHTLKVELVHRERYVTRRLAKTKIFEYLEIYFSVRENFLRLDTEC
jgi:putative transposase